MLGVGVTVTTTCFVLAPPKVPRKHLVKAAASALLDALLQPELRKLVSPLKAPAQEHPLCCEQQQGGCNLYAEPLRKGSRHAKCVYLRRRAPVHAIARRLVLKGVCTQCKTRMERRVARARKWQVALQSVVRALKGVRSGAECMRW